MSYPQPPRSIAILRLSAIGDTCNVVPIVRTLQQAFVDTELTWFIGQTEASLLADLDGVRMVVINKKQLGQAIRKVRQSRFDVLLHMHASLRANAIAAAIKAERKIGFDATRARDGMRWVINDTIDTPPDTHVLDGFFGFTEKLGIEKRCLQWNIPIPDQDLAFATALKGTEQPLVVINPSSSIRKRNYRNWSIERYAALADHAHQHYDAKVVLTGGPSETERNLAQRIRAECTYKPINLVGETSLKRLLAIASVANVMIAPDTGPAHIAASTGTPVIGLFASSNPKRTGPYLSLEHCIDRYPDACQQYLQKDATTVRWGQRVRDPQVMDLISVNEVQTKLKAILNTPT